MEAIDVLQLIAGGETSRIQFKENITNAVSVAQEMVAFANSKGGKILVGINDKTGEITGLGYQDIQRINILLTTAASEHVKSPVIIETETIAVDGKHIIIVTVPEGTDKPHMDNSGLIFLKNGADKRKVTSKEEIARLLQSSGNLYAEEMPVHHSAYKDVDWAAFKTFYRKKYKEEPEDDLFAQYLHNLRLGKDGVLNVAGALLFGKDLEYLLPQFYVSAVWFTGNVIVDSIYNSSENIRGSLYHQYRNTIDFIKTKINYVQGDRDFNSAGEPEIPMIVLQELLINALVHRDYFINDSVKVFIFRDRIEIKSPGKLPNSLTVDEMKSGLRKPRNFIINSLATDLLPFKGIGSGILRALQAYPHITFINDVQGELFTVIIQRPKVG